MIEVSLSCLVSLPVKMGGMGVLNHRECSLHARAACVEAADGMLIDVLEQGMPDGETDEVKGQGDRCREAFTTRRDALLERMDDLERKSMAGPALVTVCTGIALGFAAWRPDPVYIGTCVGAIYTTSSRAS
jgi:hypothetical protein